MPSALSADTRSAPRPAWKDPDVVIIGSGVGGAAVALQLARTGARVQILERGPHLPVEPENASAEAVFVQRRYRVPETWQTETGQRFAPGQTYFVGGHTKFFGTAMFRFRERDFEATEHADGVSPAWPFGYAELEPWYGLAERLFGVHGRAGEDPTEPWRSTDYPHPPVPHEPVIERLAQDLKARGWHPFAMPSAVDFNPGGRCVRCGSCDAFACRHGAKGDAELRLLGPALAHPNVRLSDCTRALRLRTDEAGRRVVGVEVEGPDGPARIQAAQFVLSAGAIHSALLLQRSANSHHPEGLANRSGCVGRHYMNHNTTGLMALMPWQRNGTQFPKTLALNDHYHGAPGERWPLGNLQMLGKIREPMVRATHPTVPRWAGRWMSAHSIDMLVMSEDLPHRDSTVRPLPEDRVELAWRRTNQATHQRFVERTRALWRELGAVAVLAHPFGVETPSHQCGTVRMGADPADSALDPWCQAHEHPNLHVVDASCLPSSAALNPALTVAAIALRAGDRLARSLA